MNNNSYDESEVRNINSDNAHNLSRNETLNLLQDIRNVQTKLIDFKIEEIRQNNLLEKNEKLGERIKEYTPFVVIKESLLLTCGATLGMFIFGMITDDISFGQIILMFILLYIVVWILLSVTWHNNHDNQLKEEAAAVVENLNIPVFKELEKLNKERNDYIDTGIVDWAVSIVGGDIFDSVEALEEIRTFITSRRADSLKEAFRLYDEAEHRSRMELMQGAIQNAVEIQAEESVKQTAYSKEIAKSTHQAATAAKATAYHTRKIKRDVHKIERTIRH